jgi:pimeloyl-ACP methyl ester carboxylesterase
LVAREATLASPHAWASLTLLCSGPAGFDSDDRVELLEAAEAIRRDGLEATYVAKRERDRRRGAPEPPPEIEQFLHKRFLANSPESLAAIAATLATAPDRTGELARLDLPVAVMRGQDDDGWPHAVQADMAMRLGTKEVVVAGAAHSPAVEAPEPTRDALVRVFLGH